MTAREVAMQVRAGELLICDQAIALRYLFASLWPYVAAMSDDARVNRDAEEFGVRTD